MSNAKLALKHWRFFRDTGMIFSSRLGTVAAVGITGLVKMLLDYCMYDLLMLWIKSMPVLKLNWTYPILDVRRNDERSAFCVSLLC